MVKIKQNLALRKNYGSKRNTNKIKYIVVHYTANDGDTDESNARWFKSAYRGASAHYFVDDDSITQSVPDNYVAWSVGGSRYSNYKTTGGAKLYKKATNTNTLNIEMCDDIKNGKYDVSEKTLQNTVDLVVAKMKEYNIPMSNLIRHFDVTGKSCPAYFVSDENKWMDFRNRVASAFMHDASAPTTKYIHNGLDYSKVFDSTYYANKYTDLKNVFGNNSTSLFNHFIQCGINEGRQAISTFSVLSYKNNYKDLRNAFGNNLPKYVEHYIALGIKEGRKGI